MIWAKLVSSIESPRRIIGSASVGRLVASMRSVATLSYGSMADICAPLSALK